MSTKGKEMFPGKEDDLDEDMDNVNEPMKLPRGTGAESDCIRPCSEFKCFASYKSCDQSCNDILENPCVLCEYDCDVERKEALLRDEYKKYKHMFGDVAKSDMIHKERIVERRFELRKKKEEIEEKKNEIELVCKNSFLPDAIAKMLHSRKLKKLNTMEEELDKRMEEGSWLFGVR